MQCPQREDLIMYAQIHRTETPAFRNAGAPWGEIPATQQQVQEFEVDEPLFCQGDNANFVYELLEGVVCCYNISSDGRRQVLSFGYPGDLIGLVQGDTHRYSSEVLVSARILRIPRSMLLATASQRPELGQKLLRFATTELAVMQDHFAILGRKSAVEKVAAFLLASAKRCVDEDGLSATFDLPMTRADIGDYLGLTLETVSRSMTALKISGAIDLPQPHTLVVRDILALENIADEEGEHF